MKSSTKTLIKAMQILSTEVQSEDGVANTAILEASERLMELEDKLQMASLLCKPHSLEAHNLKMQAKGVIDAVKSVQFRTEGKNCESWCFASSLIDYSEKLREQAAKLKE